MRKEDTPSRNSRRKYEKVHFVERKEANKVWGTSVPRTFADELDEFLKENNISKAGFLYMSFDLIKEQYKNK